MAIPHLHRLPPSQRNIMEDSGSTGHSRRQNGTRQSTAYSLVVASAFIPASRQALTAAPIFMPRLSDHRFSFSCCSLSTETVVALGLLLMQTIMNRPRWGVKKFMKKYIDLSAYDLYSVFRRGFLPPEKKKYA